MTAEMTSPPDRQETDEGLKTHAGIEAGDRDTIIAPICKSVEALHYVAHA